MSRDTACHRIAAWRGPMQVVVLPELEAEFDLDRVAVESLLEGDAEALLLGQKAVQGKQAPRMTGEAGVPLASHAYAQSAERQIRQGVGETLLVHAAHPHARTPTYFSFRYQQHGYLGCDEIQQIGAAGVAVRER